VTDRATRDRTAPVPEADDEGALRDGRRYVPRAFWEERLAARFDLDGVGFRGLGVPFNEALYRQREVVLKRAVRRYHLPATGADVIELGPGTGFYVALWRSWEVGSLVGLDVTEVVPQRLAARFPEYRFEQADITERWPVPDASADIVTAFDVLFHVVDDARFTAAIAEAGRVTRPGGHVLISDLFMHRSDFRGFHQASRNLRVYQAALDGAGFDVLGRLPIFVTMHPAFDVRAGFVQRVARAWWRRLSRFLRSHPGAGRPLGTVLGLVDRSVTAVLRDGPSQELLVARRRSAP
jgi:SAM-dependent methyltransferase